MFPIKWKDEKEEEIGGMYRQKPIMEFKRRKTKKSKEKKKGVTLFRF